jgi:hypothetical protein
MKRKYTEPVVMMENFKLSDYIASGCDTQITSVNSTDTSTGCLPQDLQSLNTSPRNYFVETLGCSTVASSDNVSGAHCYYALANSIFTS